MTSRSSCTFMRVVSITTSAMPRKAASSLRSSAMPSATVPSGESGCLRRVSLKRCDSVSSAESRKTTSSSSSLGPSSTGRLSRQNQPASSSARIAVDLPPPDMPVSSTMRSGGANSLHLVADTPCHRGLGDLARELLLEVLGRVVPLQREQVVAGGDLDDGGQVAAGAHRHDEQRHLGVEHAVLLLLDAQAVVLDAIVPLDQLHHHLDLLAVAYRRHAEQVLDVDDADPADLHVVLVVFQAAPVHRAALLLLQVDDVVRDQAVAARHQ